jgi:hypothetical protein
MLLAAGRSAQEGEDEEAVLEGGQPPAQGLEVKECSSSQHKGIQKNLALFHDWDMTKSVIKG